jgi:hypothetical protein
MLIAKTRIGTISHQAFLLAAQWTCHLIILGGGTVRWRLCVNRYDSVVAGEQLPAVTPNCCRVCDLRSCAHGAHSLPTSMDGCQDGNILVRKQIVIGAIVPVPRVRCS